jgi:hypothetical protein
MNIRLLSVLLTLLCILVNAEAGHCQRHFVMTTEKYDRVNDRWAAPMERAYFWKKADGEIDSVLVEYAKDTTIRIFKDWRKVSWHLDTGALHRAPHQFAQLGTRRRTPLRTEHYSVAGGDTTLISYDSMYMEDTLLMAYYKGITPTFSEAELYSYSPLGELIRREALRYYSGKWHFDYVDTIDKQYDDLGRPTQSVLRMKQSDGIWEMLDSQIFIYDIDNTVRTAMKWRRIERQISIIERLELIGWHRFEFNSYGFRNLELMVGGNQFLKCAYHRWSDDSSKWIPWGFVDKRYGANGELEEALTDHPEQGPSNGIFSYYPSGDTKDQRTRSRGDTTYRSYFRDNTYASDGRLLSSIWIYDGSPLYRYTLTYPDMSSVERTGPEFTSEPTRPGAHLVVYTILGGKLREFISSSTELDLPSGLYFISIDGSKPRKHLIP